MANPESEFRLEPKNDYLKPIFLPKGKFNRYFVGLENIFCLWPKNNRFFTGVLPEDGT